jgi:hypothetical protein
MLVRTNIQIEPEESLEIGNTHFENLGFFTDINPTFNGLVDEITELLTLVIIIHIDDLQEIKSRLGNIYDFLKW